MRNNIVPISILFAITVVSEVGALQQRMAVPSGVVYDILSDETAPSVKRSVDVRLNRRVSRDVLRAIAVEIRAKDARRYPRTFILYYLPGMEVDRGAWASSHFNPELQIEVLGTTAEEHAALTDPSALSATSSREIIGIWLDERPYSARRLTLYRENGKVFMESTFRDGSVGSDEMKQSTTRRGIRFASVEPSAADDHYLINSGGQLEMRDVEGLIATARRVSAR